MKQNNAIALESATKGVIGGRGFYLVTYLSNSDYYNCRVWLKTGLVEIIKNF